MSTSELLLLLVAGIAAGGVNAVAGGGSLVSFPALLAVGIPPLSANVTNSVAVWPGYVGTSWGYRVELGTQLKRLAGLAPAALLGAGAGCVLLLRTGEETFEQVVPYLVILGSLLLAVQGRVTERVRRWRGAGNGARSPLLHVCLAAAAAYGAYFGGGLGVVLLACLGLFIADDLQRLNGLKSVLSLVINFVALVVFALFGPVVWSAVAVVAPAALLGGYLGAHVARRLSASALRGVIVVFGIAVGIALL